MHFKFGTVFIRGLVILTEIDPREYVSKANRSLEIKALSDLCKRMKWMCTIFTCVLRETYNNWSTAVFSTAFAKNKKWRWWWEL